MYIGNIHRPPKRKRGVVLGSTAPLIRLEAFEFCLAEWYFNIDSTEAGAPASTSPTYPT